MTAFLYGYSMPMYVKSLFAEHNSDSFTVPRWFSTSMLKTRTPSFGGKFETEEVPFTHPNTYNYFKGSLNEREFFSIVQRYGKRYQHRKHIRQKRILVECKSKDSVYLESCVSMKIPQLYFECFGSERITLQVTIRAIRMVTTRQWTCRVRPTSKSTFGRVMHFIVAWTYVRHGTGQIRFSFISRDVNLDNRFAHLIYWGRNRLITINERQLRQWVPTATW